jgi:hypothetical protein
VYFINFYRKWVGAPRLNALAVAYEDLTGEQARTLAAVVSFIQGDSSVDQAALARIGERYWIRYLPLSFAESRKPKSWLFCMK